MGLWESRANVPKHFISTHCITFVLDKNVSAHRSHLSVHSHLKGSEEDITHGSGTAALENSVTYNCTYDLSAVPLTNSAFNNRGMGDDSQAVSDTTINDFSWHFSELNGYPALNETLIQANYSLNLTPTPIPETSHTMDDTDSMEKNKSINMSGAQSNSLPHVGGSGSVHSYIILRGQPQTACSL